MKKIISFSAVLGLLPVLAFAQTSAGIIGMLAVISQILGVLLPILLTVAVLYFIWGVIQYMTGKEEEQKKAGRTKIINGLIGLFVIVAFWGIIKLFSDTFGVGPTQVTEEVVPCVPNPLANITCTD